MVGAPAQGPFCRDPLDPLETLAWEKVVIRLSMAVFVVLQFLQTSNATMVVVFACLKK